MLFVLAGYGGSLYKSWMNSVWGKAKQRYKKKIKHTQGCIGAHSTESKKDLLRRRELTEEVNVSLRWSLQSSSACKHGGAPETSAASP